MTMNKFELPDGFGLCESYDGVRLYYNGEDFRGTWLVEPNGGLEKTLDLVQRMLSGEFSTEEFEQYGEAL